jgi:predicted amidohydrolase YtcJ
MCLFCQSGNSSRLRFRAAGRSVAERLAGVADVILTGGDILTMDHRAPRTTALSVRDGLVQSVGSLEAVLAHKGRSTRIVDIQGATIIPGMILPALPKSLVALLDWQEIDLGRADGDVHGYLSRTVVPPLFSAPVFIRLVNAAGAARHPGLLAALEKQCGAVPIAVQVDGTDAGLANRAMFRLAGRAAVTEHGSAAPFVTDVAALLNCIASGTAHSASSIGRALERAVAAARRDGYTTVVDRAMGAVGGRDEVEAAASQLAARRYVRMRGVAHRRLREEWDGRLPDEVRPDMLSIDAALLEGGQAVGDLLGEAWSLNEAGWRLVFSAGSRDELDVVLEVCRILRPVLEDRAPRIEVQFVPDRTDLDAVRQLGVILAVVADADGLSSGTSARPVAGCNPLNIDGYLAAVTRDAADQCGLADIAGTIARGKYADFTLLEGPPEHGKPLRIAGTWVDGIPVS